MTQSTKDLLFIAAMSLIAGLAVGFLLTATSR